MNADLNESEVTSASEASYAAVSSAAEDDPMH
jgi:hypothetical protein